ncbi:3'-5' exoribonuclease YhaM family protein [Acidipila sp. EB88]|uniref:3'-5' exoribonuclease YhaM family protein n=1 Tax=Acidipila sp. EB88 TaxID=2305226 RepID=UPI000F601DEF|nr:HD domain-containing protein [Acidipila sp. EB88]RRA48672.1 HD domain-containing protein [Acidipila sp. EB88]
MKELFATDLARFENQTVTAFFAAASRQLRTKADGSGYLCITLADCTGQLEGRMWEIKDDAGEFEAGDILKVRGLVSRYQEKLQIKLDRVRRADPVADAGEYDLGDFVPKTSFDIDDLWSRLTAYVASFVDPHLRALLELFLGDPTIATAMREAPAAKALHHAWIGGLLEHIVSLLDVCDSTARHYPEVNRDLLLAGAMLHDIGKLHELSWGTNFAYTVEGQLLGHISIGASMIDQKLAQLPDFPPRLRTLLLHLVLSHHGRLEFGSPKLPMTAEALLLHYLDDLEAKMQTFRSEFKRAVANGARAGEPTDYIRSMERPLLDSRAFLAGENKQG